MKIGLHHISIVCASLSFVAAAGLTFGAICDCGPSTPATKTAEAVASTVLDETCKLLEAQSDPLWVTLLCTAEGAVSSVLVKLPRVQYNAMRVARADAGPGK